MLTCVNTNKTSSVPFKVLTRDWFKTEEPQQTSFYPPHTDSVHGCKGRAKSIADGLPVWLRLCTINTLGPMQTIPQISHLSFPLGSRIPPAEEKALASGLGCEPFTLAPEASITRKSSAHSSSSTPFMSQASPFSSSLRASTLMLQAGKEGKEGRGGHGLEYEHGSFMKLCTDDVTLMLRQKNRLSYCM